MSIMRRCICCENVLDPQSMGALCSKCRTDEVIEGDFKDIISADELGSVEEITDDDIDDIDAVLS